MGHSYEEIRAAAIDLLAGRETASHQLTQYLSLQRGVAEVLQSREGGGSSYDARRHREANLDSQDTDLFREVFWDLIRQSIITPGLNDSNQSLPFFSLSSHGRRILANQDTHFYHDVTSYEARLTSEVSSLDRLTLLYAKESMQAYRAGCMLSSSVMLGVATEHAFELMLEAAVANQAHGSRFNKASKEWGTLRRATAFRKAMDDIASQLPPELREDADTYFAGILSIIRNYRNQSGHPSGIIVDREQCYVLLQLFIPYVKKMYQLKDYFEAAP